MPIDNGSGIRVETNCGGEFYDNDDFISAKAELEHNVYEQSERPWAQSYTPTDEEALQKLYTKKSKVKQDPAINRANRKKLKDQGITDQ